MQQTWLEPQGAGGRAFRQGAVTRHSEWALIAYFASTAALAAAFGLWRISPERRWFSGLAFLCAALVLVATIVGRCHYAMDGVAGVGVSALAFVVVEAMSSVG